MVLRDQTQVAHLASSYTCVCSVCMCIVCVCLCVCLMCACTCMQKPEEDIRCPAVSTFCLTSFIRDLSLNVKLDWPAANPSNPPVSDPLPQHRSNRHMQPCLFFFLKRCWRFELRYSCLPSKCFYPSSHLSSP